MQYYLVCSVSDFIKAFYRIIRKDCRGIAEDKYKQNLL